MVVNQTKVYSVFMSDYDSYNEAARYLDKEKAEEVAEILGHEVIEETVEHENFSIPGYEYIKKHNLKEYTIRMGYNEHDKRHWYLVRNPIISTNCIDNIIIARKLETDDTWIDYVGHVWATSEEVAVEYIKSYLEKNENEDEFFVHEELFIDEDYYADRT